MVGVAGFEPATPASRTQCSTGLSHTPTKNAAYSLGFRATARRRIKEINPSACGPENADFAGRRGCDRCGPQVLAEGGLVAFPTETVYGLGADAANAAAIAHLYQAKGRPAFNPLIAHVGDLDAARKIARFDAVALRLAETFWPGPLTLVLPKAQNCPVAELGDRGPRYGRDPHSRPPGRARHPARLRRRRGGAVGQPLRPRLADHWPRMCEGDLEGRIDLIVDGGAVEVGVESTIVGCFDGPMLLRPGGDAARGDRARARPRAGAAARRCRERDGQPLAPGMLASHYAPRASVRLDAEQVEAGEALLAFGPDAMSGVDAAAAVHESVRERRSR